jgi:hypothetical protein
MAVGGRMPNHLQMEAGFNLCTNNETEISSLDEASGASSVKKGHIRKAGEAQMSDLKRQQKEFITSTTSAVKRVTELIESKQREGSTHGSDTIISKK